MSGHIKGIVSDKEALRNTLMDFDLNNGSPKELSEAIDKAMMQMLTIKNAIAVAANQIGYDKRFFVCRYDLLKYPTIQKKNLNKIKYFDESIYINPRYVPVKGSRLVDSHEGCLSHDKELVVKRYSSITFSGLQLYVNNGGATVVPFECVLKGYSAAIAQHEIDHLDGIGIWIKASNEEEAVSVS